MDLADFRQRLEVSFGVFDGDNSDDPLGAFLRDEENDAHFFFRHSLDDGNDSSEEEEEHDIVVGSLDRIFNTDATTTEEDEGIYMCEGDLCDLGDECRIPDTFKAAHDKDSAVDVMAFLGIQRAKPLKVEKHDSEWQ